MSWQDIERCCVAASASATDAERAHLRTLQPDLGVHHSEATLALFVNIHIRGGSKDLATNLRGLTMRVAAVDQFIRILRDSAYPECEGGGTIGAAKVEQRLRDCYATVQCTAALTPAAVLAAFIVKPFKPLLIVHEKNATTAEPCRDVTDWRILQPHHIVAGKSAWGQGNIHEDYTNVFAQYGTFEIRIAWTFPDQFHLWYLCIAFPFTMSVAVRGYYVPNHER